MITLNSLYTLHKNPDVYVYVRGVRREAGLRSRFNLPLSSLYRSWRAAFTSGMLQHVQCLGATPYTFTNRALVTCNIT